MRKVLKRCGWLFIATGILALAYYIGNQTGPSIPNETTPYDPADLAPPTPIAEESSTPDSESTPPGQVDHVGEGRRARIISVTAIRKASQSRRNPPVSLPRIINGQLAERKPVRVEVVGVQSLPTKQLSPGMIPSSSISLVQRKDVNDSMSQASAKRQASANLTPRPHAILSLSPALPQGKAPVAAVRKRRPLADEDVAWHVIDNPAAPSPRGVPAAAQLFSQELEVAPSENSATGGPNLDEPKAIPAPVTPPRTIIPVGHVEAGTRTRENDPAPSPANSLPEMTQGLDPSRVLPRILPDVQALPLSNEPVRVEEAKTVSPTERMTNTNAMPTSKERQAPPAVRLPIESIGVVFLESPEQAPPSPPGKLPSSVMESAPLLATQKLINRSLGSSKGVAASLVNASCDRRESATDELILTGAVMEGNGVVKPYTTTGVVNFRASKEEIAAQAHLDYVTSGLVILPATGEPTITPPLAIQERLLKNAIREACGDKVKNLEVALESNHALKIRLQVANEADRKELTQTILTLPALSSYQIALSMQAIPQT